jgi:acyl transferase domain-containing protein
MSLLDPLSEPELSLPAYDQSAAIVIVGMSFRFPKAAGPDVFWRLLSNSEDAITEVPTDRQEIRAAIRYGGFIDQVGSFDAGFFGISPRQAAAPDPQARLMLEPWQQRVRRRRCSGWPV